MSRDTIIAKDGPGEGRRQSANGNYCGGTISGTGKVKPWRTELLGQEIWVENRTVVCGRGIQLKFNEDPWRSKKMGSQRKRFRIYVGVESGRC